MAEQFLIKTEGGGPHDGSRITDGTMDWPLPDDLPDEGGRYVKVSESRLPPMPEDGHVIRGALYSWEASDG
jgi:hypothetical protein